MVDRDSGVGIWGSGQKTRFWGVGARCWGGALILLTMLTSQAAGADEPFGVIDDGGLRLTVRVFDYAGIGARTLRAASKEAASVLGKAGVTTEWQFCEVVQGHVPGACHAPLQFGEVEVRIIQRGRPRKGRLGATECGEAFETAEGVGVLANLYADCLAAMPDVDGITPSVMLGHVLAHEIGHLLLPGKDHSSQGVMRPQMRPEDWQLARVGLLVFTSRQAALLRAEVANRQRRALAAAAGE
jgi:hypothetical protein